MPSSLKSLFGLRVRDLRRAAGISQDDLASAIAATQKEVSEYEHGRSFPRPERIERIAHVLGIEIGDLFSVKVRPAVKAPDLSRIVALIESRAHDTKYLRRALRVLRAIDDT